MGVEEKKVEVESDNKEKKKEKAEKPKKETPPPPPPVHKKDFEKDTVYLYQFPRCPQLPNISPKCLKVETWLKLHGIKYENVNHNAKLRSKRGLLPFIELNGEEIADSEIIIKSLAKTYNKDLDASLNQEQKNIQHAMLTMVDNHLHGAFMMWATRNADNLLQGYKLNLQQLMGMKIPAGILNFLFKHSYCRKGLAKAKASGFKGYTAEEVEEEGKKDLLVLKEMLGEQQFFFGDEPHSLDLVGFYNRMKDRAWGDHWEEAIGDKMELNPHIPKPEPPVEEKEEEKKEAEEATDGKKKEEDKEKGDKNEKEKEEKKEEEEKKE